MKQKTLVHADVKNCPFCGKEPGVTAERNVLFTFMGESLTIKCESYKCQIKPKITRNDWSEALEIWNKRK